MTEKKLNEIIYMMSSKINYFQDIDGTGFTFSIEKEINSKDLLNYILPTLMEVEESDYNKMIKLLKIDLDKIPVFEWEREEINNLKEWIDSSFLYLEVLKYVDLIKTNNQNDNNEKITIGNRGKILI